MRKKRMYFIWLFEFKSQLLNIALTPFLENPQCFTMRNEKGTINLSWMRLDIDG